MFFEDLAMVMSIGGLILSIVALLMSEVIGYIKKRYEISVVGKNSKLNSINDHMKNYELIKLEKHINNGIGKNCNFEEYNIVIKKTA